MLRRLSARAAREAWGTLRESGAWKSRWPPCRVDVNELDHGVRKRARGWAVSWCWRCLSTGQRVCMNAGCLPGTKVSIAM